MLQVTVGTKYQIVIPKEIRRKRSIKPGSKVNIIEDKQGKITLEPVQKTWVERTAGMMTEAWKNIDPVEELEKMKNEWEERLKKQEKIWNETK